jgi:glycosyltransferase involved in cell wall biosynthesis
VACVSACTRDQILAHRLVAEEKLSVIPNGVHPSCSPHPDVRIDQQAGELLIANGVRAEYLLHVGSTIPRKRIDTLLRVFAEVRRRGSSLQLVRVGPEFTREQVELAKSLNVENEIVVFPAVPRPVLNALYRKAVALLQTSDREGFGLPVIESMACGTPVLASDIAILREIGGAAAEYCPVDDRHCWADRVMQITAEKQQQPAMYESRSRSGLAQAAKFSWDKHISDVAAVYRRLAA